MMEDTEKLQEIQEMLDQAAVEQPAPADRAEDAGPVATRKNMTKYRKFLKKQARAYKLFMQREATKAQARQKRLKRLSEMVGKNILLDLVQKNTTISPEVRDADGKVTQEESRRLDFDSVERQCREIIVINREGRIVSGKRKRSTGRGSDRSSHSAQFKFLLDRALRVEATKFEAISQQNPEPQPSKE